MLGAVLSMLMPLTVALALLPAMSVAVPVTLCPAPSAVSVTGGVSEAMPEVGSAAVKVTVTSVLFQPKAFAAGDREPVIIGGVSSTLTVSVLVASTLPALSV